MDLNRLRPADWLTGLSGVALLVFLFCPWYGLSDGRLNAWESLKLIDLWLLLTAALAIAVLVVTALRDSPALPVAMDVLSATAATVALLLVIFRLLNIPDENVVTGREWGLFAAAVATFGAFAGSWWAQRDESSPGVRPHPPIQAMPAPPANAGPERTGDGT